VLNQVKIAAADKLNNSINVLRFDKTTYELYVSAADSRHDDVKRGALWTCAQRQRDRHFVAVPWAPRDVRWRRRVGAWSSGGSQSTLENGERAVSGFGPLQIFNRYKLPTFESCGFELLRHALTWPWPVCVSLNLPSNRAVRLKCVPEWSRPAVRNLFYMSSPFIEQDYQIYPNHTQWCSFIKNTKLTMSYSWEWFTKIYIFCNLWFSKFTPWKFTYPGLRATGLA